MAGISLKIDDLRAWWARRQGLDGSLAGKSGAEVLARAGWARSVGGCGPYLTIHARAGSARAPIDAAVARLEYHELPSARGCTYVLPAQDYALGLTLAQAYDEVAMKEARKLGVTDAEMGRLGEKVLAALGSGPLEPEQIKDAVGGAVRNLGEEGRKRGMITTLPAALGLLQSRGAIRRVPVNGRLDQQRYRYTLWEPNPRAQFKLPLEECYVELARKFWRWIGPASLAEFQWFSGLGVKAARQAAGPLKLVPLGDGSDRLLFGDDREALLEFKAPKAPRYALVSGLDSLVLLRRNHRDLMEPGDLKRPLIGRISDLPSHAIVDRGRVAGLWEFDQDAGAIVYVTFGKVEKGLREAVARTEEWVKQELGDARSFSLDSPKSRAPKIAALRKAAGR